MNMFDQLLYTDLAGTPIWRWLVFFVTVLVSLVVGRIAKYLLLLSAKKMERGDRQWVAVILKAASRPAVFLFFAIGMNIVVPLGIVTVPSIATNLVSVVLRILLAVGVGWAVYSLVDLIDYGLSLAAEKTVSKVDDMLVPLVGRSIRITVLVVVILMVIQEVSNEDLKSILAGLGIGGIALALAAQDTLKNFFGSLVIIADKPFEIGDRIVVDGHDGPVETVGFRSTKIRTLQGHLVTVPNSEVANKTIQNIGKRPYIRRLLNITLTYDTPPENVARAKKIVEELLENHEGMNPEYPPRVFFNDFNDWSLNLLVLYWYSPPDYWAFMAFSERFNMQLLERFNAEGIDFAFPSQTLYHENLSGSSCSPEPERAES